MKWIGFGVHPLGEVKGEQMTGQSFRDANRAVGMASGAMISRQQRETSPNQVDKGSRDPKGRDATPQGGTEVDRARTGRQAPSNK